MFEFFAMFSKTLLFRWYVQVVNAGLARDSASSYRLWSVDVERCTRYPGRWHKGCGCLLRCRCRFIIISLLPCNPLCLRGVLYLLKLAAMSIFPFQILPELAAEPLQEA